MSQPRYVVRTPRIDQAQLQRGMTNLPRVLKQLGYPSMRTGQDRIVSCVMAGRDTLGILPTGCHAKGQGILMADGSVKLVENIQVGDLVMGWDGTSRAVIQLKQGVAPCSKISPLKRNDFVVTDNHVLTLVRTAEKANPKYACQRRSGEVVDVTVEEYNTWAKWKKHIHKMFAATVPEFHRPQQLLFIDPYFMGVLLGDGTFRKASVEVCKPDPEIRQECERQAEQWGIGFTCDESEVKADGRMSCPTYRLHNNGKHNNPLTKELQRLELWNLGSPDKFIPDVYKFSTTPARKALLAGLLDTDGHKMKGGYDFISASKRLATDLVFVTRSLGLYAADPKECEKSCGDFTGTYWRVFVSGAVLPTLGLRIARKIPDATTSSKRDVLRCGFKVTPVGDREFYGFTITGDGRYLMDDFTVTHNSGKTDCFVIPILACGLKALVFSPLISLMRDQLQSSMRKGVRAGSITSHDNAMGVEYMKQWLRGDLDLLYVAPERLRRDDFLEVMRKVPPDLVCLDEAHCLSTWSMTFRPAYKVIGDFITEFKPKQLLALTATCPPQVEQDVRHVMCMDDAHKEVYFPRRNNLVLKSEEWTSAAPLLTLLERVTDGSAIVYCATRAQVEKTAKEIQDMSGQDVGYYHGGMNPSQRSHAQDRFMSGETPWVVATNAFGMGVDRSNVRLVVHRDIPGSIEALSQEIGRAGRDGKQSLCQTYFDQASVRTHHFLINLSSPSFEEVKQVYKALHQLVDRSTGVVNASNDEVANAAGLKTYKLGAIMSILSGARVTDRTKADEKVCSIKLRNRVDDARLISLMEILHQCGNPADDGYTDISLALLSAELGVSDATVKKRLTDMSKSQMIEYVPPEKSKPIKLIGDLNQVDARTVDELRAVAFAKLDQVITYANDVPDVDKHRHIEDMLGITSC